MIIDKLAKKASKRPNPVCSKATPSQLESSSFLSGRSNIYKKKSSNKPLKKERRKTHYFVVYARCTSSRCSLSAVPAAVLHFSHFVQSKRTSPIYQLSLTQHTNSSSHPLPLPSYNELIHYQNQPIPNLIPPPSNPTKLLLPLFPPLALLLSVFLTLLPPSPSCPPTPPTASNSTAPTSSVASSTTTSQVMFPTPLSPPGMASCAALPSPPPPSAPTPPCTGGASLTTVMRSTRSGSTGGPPPVAISAGDTHVCGLIDGTPHCWWWEEMRIPAGLSFAEIAVGRDFVYRRFDCGKIKCYESDRSVVMH